MLLLDPEFIFPGAQQGGNIFVSEKAEIFGNLFSTGRIELHGTCHGNVITQGFLLQNGSGVYENYLLDGVMTREGISNTYLMGIVQGKGAQRGLIRKLRN